MAMWDCISRGAGKLQCVQALKKEKMELENCLKSSQTIAAELQCQVVKDERLLLEKEEKEKAWEEERAGLMQEKDRLNVDVKHYKFAASVSSHDVETLYAEFGIV
ncbi:hypothetical protein Hdeb2414_s0012g00394711 [Helianthus debilis subsp. tardiflorus]